MTEALPVERQPGVRGVPTGEAVWALVAMTVGAALAPLEPSVLEEGAHLHVAERLAGGEQLYRDVVFFSGLLPFELLGLLFRVLGDSVFIGRAVVVLLQGGAAAAVFALARHAGAGGLAHAAAAFAAFAPVAAFPLLTVYFYTTIGVYLVPVTLYAALRGLDSPRAAAAAGGGVVAVGLCKQTLGAALLVLIPLWLVAHAARDSRSSRIGAFAAGGGLAGVAVLGVYAARGLLVPAFDALVTTPLSLSESFRLPFPNLWPPGRFQDEVAKSALLYVPKVYFVLESGPKIFVPEWIIGLSQVLYALPPVLLAATALLRLRRRLPAVVWLHAIGVLALLTNLYPRPDWGHLSPLLPATLVHGVLLLGLPRDPRRGRAAPEDGEPVLNARSVAGALAVGFAIASVAGAIRLHERSAAPAFGPRVPLRPVSWSYKTENVPRVVGYLRKHTREDEPILVARQEPLLYFATDTRNPTPWVGILAGRSEEQQRVLLSALEDVRHVVMSEIDQPGYHFYAEELPRVYAYLERHFRMPVDLHRDPGDWLHVFVRGEDRGRVLTDLVRARRREEPWVRTWVRGEDGEIRETEAEPFVIPPHRLRRPLPIFLGPRGGGVDFELTVPERAVFQADVGLRFVRSPAGHILHPLGTWMDVSVARDGGFERLHRSRISVSPSAGLRWTPIEVDLSGLAGRTVTLRLEVIPMDPRQAGRYAWWGSPRIARRPEPETAAAGRRDAAPPPPPRALPADSVAANPRSQ